MTKKDVCLNNKTIAYYSGFGGIEIKYIENGITDYVYGISGAWSGKKSYHKLKVYSDKNGDFYVKLNGFKLMFNEFIRTDIF